MEDQNQGAEGSSSHRRSKGLHWSNKTPQSPNSSSYGQSMPASATTAKQTGFNWTDTLYHVDKGLEIVRNIGEAAGPAGGAIKATCGILQALLKIATDMRQNEDGLDELVAKLNQQLNLLEEQDRRFNKSPLTPEHVSESGIQGSLDTYRTDLYKMHEILEGLKQKSTSGTKIFLKKLAKVRSIQESLKDCSQKLDASFQKLLTSVTFLILAQTEELLNRQVLDKLPIPSPARHHSKCLDGTRTIILKEIRNWAKDPNAKPIFALVDQAGTGKSTIATSMIEEWSISRRLGARFYFTKPSIVNAEKLASSLSKDLAEKIVPVRHCIIKALHEHEDFIKDSVSHQLDWLVFTPLRDTRHALEETLKGLPQERKEKRGMESPRDRPKQMLASDNLREADTAYLNALKEVRMGSGDQGELEKTYVAYLDALEQALTEALDHTPIIVIDALDECSARDRRLILKAIFGSLSQSRSFKLFLTCRPESDIYPLITDHDNLICRPTHSLLSDANKPDRDIYTYANKYLQPILNPNQISQFVARASGLFIWASTAKEFLDVDKALVMGRFNSLINPSPHTSPLSSLYTEILTAVARKHKHEARLLKKILQFIAGPYEPLTLNVMGEFLTTGQESGSAIVGAIVNSLGSVLSDGMNDEAVYALHPTFIEYLQENSQPDVLQFSEDEVDELFATSCLTILNAQLHYDIYAVVQPNTPVPFNDEIEDLEERIQKMTTQGLCYAAMYCLWHVADCVSNDAVMEQLQIVFQRQLMHWIELASILRWIPSFVDSLHALQVSIEDRINTEKQSKVVEMILETLLENRDWCRDTIHMLRPFQELVESSAMQIYYSALPFVPSTSPISRFYHKAFARTIPKVLCGTWTINNHSIVVSGYNGWVQCLAFSPDGRDIACGSTRGRIRLWDVFTGTIVEETPEASTMVSCLSFSPDGQHLAFGSENGAVSLIQYADSEGEDDDGDGDQDQDEDEWGIGPLSLKSHTRRVNCLSFSPEGHQIASGSYDRTLLIQKVSPDDNRGDPPLLEGHTGPINCLSFSPDSRYIASGSNDCTIRLWDADTGGYIGEPLGGHTGSILCLSFSPDGRQIASGSEDGTVRLWDAQTRLALGNPLRGHNGSVIDLSFFPDGRRIVSGSEDNTIRLWDTENKEAVGNPLKGHSGSITCLALSPDGKIIASGSYDKTIRIWDGDTGAILGGPLRSHGASITCLDFSPDGRQLGSGSFDGTVRIWDIEASISIGDIFTNRSDLISTYNSSPNGHQTAPGSGDSTSHLNNAEITTKIEVLSPVDQLIFSPDGRRLVSKLYSGTISLWKADNGTLLREYRGGYPEHIIFSPDSKKLVYAEQAHDADEPDDIDDADQVYYVDDKKIWLWDAESGVTIRGLPIDHNTLVHC